MGKHVVSLLDSQNPDGGWPYQRGGPSWTEPTAYALLALETEGDAAEPVKRGIGWLDATQLGDGGWPPQPAVPRSTWVTAVVALLGPALGAAAFERGIAWLVKQTGEESNLPSRLRRLLVGEPAKDPGWPWYPGTNAWVTPTALSMLALRKAARGHAPAQIRARLDMGAAYLQQHVCRDGGWNYGAPRALDHDARSYPETTGIALLALQGCDLPIVRKARDLALAQLPVCPSSEAESWLRLGLLAHRGLPSGTPPPARQPRTVQHLALAVLAARAPGEAHPLVEEWPSKP